MALHSLAWTDAAPACLTGGAVSIGNFDGVHRGHQKLLRRVVDWAKRLDGPAVAVTFDPPPVALLNPSALKPPLTTIARRSELLHDAGADHVVALKVEPSLLALSAAAFIEEVLQKQFASRAIVEGSNFRFGRNREGDCALLRTLEHRARIHFEEVVVDAVSSSRVRAALEAGDITLAHDLLGRPYEIAGCVIEGAKRGRTLGIPTANLGEILTLIPKHGVYAASVTVRCSTWNSVVNIGPNPTFGEQARKVEAHLLGYNGDLYGQPMMIALRHRLRDVIRFDSVEALLSQVKQDIAEADAILGKP